MGTYYLYLKVVNFDATIFDVSDLSSVRGASYAANMLPEWIIENKLGCKVKKTKIASAASHALYVIECGHKKKDLHNKLEEILNTRLFPQKADDLPEKICSKNIDAVKEYLIPHLSFCYAIVQKTGDWKKDWAEMTRQISLSQSTRLSVDIPDAAMSGHKRACTQDGVRPQHIEYYPADLQDTGKVYMSHAIATRRCFGRGARFQYYYEDYIGVSGLKDEMDFSDTFEDIIADPPEIDDRLKNKIGVLSLDMKKLGDMINKMVKSEDDYEEFSAAQLKAQKSLLRAVVEAAIADESFHLVVKHENDQETIKLRLETLMLGGDEMLIVFPAWCMEAVLGVISQTVQCSGFSAKVGDEIYTFKLGVGLVIAHHKTPIRNLRALADELSTCAKDGDFDNGLQYHIAGHLEIPTNDIKMERETLFNAPDDGCPQAFTFNLENTENLFAHIRYLKGAKNDPDNGVPHSMVTRLLRQTIDSEYLLKNKNVTDAKSLYTEIGDGLQSCASVSGKKYSCSDLLGNDLLGGSDEFYCAPLLHLAWLWAFVGHDEKPADTGTSADSVAVAEDALSGEDK